MADNNIKPMGIVVDDGRRRVPITNIYGDEIGVFYFNPTDMNIIERYNKLAKSFDTILEPLERIKDDSDSEDANNIRMEAYTEAENRLNEAINALFGADASGAFFGNVNPFSPNEGKFYCERVLEVVGKYIADQFKVETEKLNSRIDKYTRKYKSKR